MKKKKQKDKDSETTDEELLNLGRREAHKKAEAVAMLERDNLRIRTITKYKTIKENKHNNFLDIENELTDLAYCKGKAFSDSSMEEMERAIESELD